MKIIVMVAAMVALSACQPGAGTTSVPAPSPAPASTAGWVVSGSGAFGDKVNGPMTFYVECVPAGDLAKPRSEQDTWRRVQVPNDNADPGDGAPCPDGKVLEQHPG